MNRVKTKVEIAFSVEKGNQLSRVQNYPFTSRIGLWKRLPFQQTIQEKYVAVVATVQRNRRTVFFPFNFRKHSNLKCTRLCEKRRKKMLGMRILTVKKNVCSNEKNVMRQSSNDRSFRGAAVVRRIVEPANTTHPNQVNTKGKRQEKRWQPGATDNNKGHSFSLLALSKWHTHTTERDQGFLFLPLFHCILSSAPLGDRLLQRFSSSKLKRNPRTHTQ